MPPSLTRWMRTRGILAVLAAALVRCAPDVGPCVALPGASIIMASRSENAAGLAPMLHSASALALRGRAALLYAQVAVAHRFR